MNALKFHASTTPPPGMLRDACVTLPNVVQLTVAAFADVDCIDVGMWGAGLQCRMSCTAHQARGLAAELLHCADLRDAARGRAEQ